MNKGFLSATLFGFFAFSLASAMRLALLCPSPASAMRLAARALPLCGAAPAFLCSGKEK
ncbi:hypothetical protein VSR68_17505 [Paraburkholderia phymatum]|uniref:hypothetical protein n=1 Tax=Paraburkholderia phymatum TaxID=148447 RepID=UPI00316D807D